jgi:hypothetical protein
LDELGNYPEVSGELLLITFAEVAPDDAALRRHHRPGVRSPYLRLPPETRGRVLPLRTTYKSAASFKTGYRTPAKMRKPYRAGQRFFPPGLLADAASEVAVGAEPATG